MPRRLKDRPPVAKDHPAKAPGHVATPPQQSTPGVGPAAMVEQTPKAYVIDGREYQRVTKIIKGGVPAPALQYWGQKVVAETAVAVHQTGMLAQLLEQSGEGGAVDWLKRAPFRSVDEAGRQGTRVHAVAEHLLTGQPLPEDYPEEGVEPLTTMASHVANVLGTVLLPEEWELVEATVWSETHGYAGTLDGLVQVNDPRVLGAVGWSLEDRGPARVLVDWKTSRGVYPDHALQLAAYRYAEKLLDHQTGEVTDIKGDGKWVDLAAVIHVRPEGWGIIPVQTHPEVFEVFLAAIQVARWDQGLAKEAVASHPALRGQGLPG